jgi:hypothetical protein
MAETKSRAEPLRPTKSRGAPVAHRSSCTRLVRKSQKAAASTRPTGRSRSRSRGTGGAGPPAAANAAPPAAANAAPAARVSLGPMLERAAAWGRFSELLRLRTPGAWEQAIKMEPLLLPEAGAVSAEHGVDLRMAPLAHLDAVTNWARGPIDASGVPSWLSAGQRATVTRAVWRILAGGGAVRWVNTLCDDMVNPVARFPPLHLACMKGAVEAVEILTSLPETDVNARDTLYRGSALRGCLMAQATGWRAECGGCAKVILATRLLDLDLDAIDGDGLSISQRTDTSADRFLNSEVKFMWCAALRWLRTAYFPGILHLLELGGLLPPPLAQLVASFFTPACLASRPGPP